MTAENSAETQHTNPDFLRSLTRINHLFTTFDEWLALKCFSARFASILDESRNFER
jgi:hypothetical protein